MPGGVERTDRVGRPANAARACTHSRTGHAAAATACVCVAPCSSHFRRCAEPLRLPLISRRLYLQRRNDGVAAASSDEGGGTGGVRRMNEVNARRARLVPGRVTVFGRVYYLGM